MRLSAFVFACVCASVASAQDPRIPKYHIPEDTTQAPEPQVTSTPITTPQSKSYFSIGKKLFNALVLGKAPEEDTVLRDERDKTDGVERLSRDNWDRVTGGGKDDVWVMLISGPPKDFVDYKYLDTHKNATLLSKTQKSRSSEKFHFARIDYMSQYEICTRWLIFRSPVIAIVSDQGRTVRWASKPLVGAGGDFFWEILEDGQWKQMPVWTSRYAPGGDRSHWVEFYLKASDAISAQMGKVPSIVWMGLFAALTQSIIKWMQPAQIESNAVRAARRQGVSLKEAAGLKVPEGAKVEVQDVPVVKVSAGEKKKK